MTGKSKERFTLKDYLSLGAALSLAFAVWLLLNLSHTYSAIVQCNVLAASDIEGRAEVSDSPSKLAARCEMDGFDLLYLRMFPDRTVEVVFPSDELIHVAGTRYCIPASSLISYSHEIFGDGTRCEYFVTDTLFFDFQAASFKRVPVIPVLIIDYKPQYMPLGKISVMPDSISIYATTRILDGIDHVNTRPLVLNEVDSDVAGELDIQPQSGVRLSSKSVDYHLTVVRYVEETLTVPVVMAGVPQDSCVVVSPSTAMLVLKRIFPGRYDSDADLKVVVDYADFASSISGRCIGRVTGLKDDVISSSILPEIFDCVQSARE